LSFLFYTSIVQLVFLSGAGRPLTDKKKWKLKAFPLLPMPDCRNGLSGTQNEQRL
jgi:hypothetical protein